MAEFRPSAYEAPTVPISAVAPGEFYGSTENWDSEQDNENNESKDGDSDYQPSSSDDEDEGDYAEEVEEEEEDEMGTSHPTTRFGDFSEGYACVPPQMKNSKLPKEALQFLKDKVDVLKRNRLYEDLVEFLGENVAREKKISRKRVADWVSAHCRVQKEKVKKIMESAIAAASAAASSASSAAPVPMDECDD